MKPILTLFVLAGLSVARSVFAAQQPSASAEKAEPQVQVVTNHVSNGTPPTAPQTEAAPKSAATVNGHSPSGGGASVLAGRQSPVPASESASDSPAGEGTASAEVIYGAAERGFTGKGYKDVFTEYQSVAEQVLDKDEIPPGYRFYVRRYFQLIRPRE